MDDSWQSRKVRVGISCGGDLAVALIEERDRPYWIERETPAPYKIWGEGLEKGALDQMAAAVRLPVAVSGALMPDAHQGYGLPIGGVLATENSVIPYAVGVISSAPDTQRLRHSGQRSEAIE